ncbi:MAG: hypothetical protein ABJG88_07685 [Litorimonas sp.]
MPNKKNSPFVLLVSFLLVNCAHVKTDETDPKIAFAIGEIQSTEMRKLTDDERVKKLSNGDIVVTNACGHSVTKFEIVNSTGEVENYLTDEDRIGEWCKPPYDFEIGTYFLVVDIDGQSILDSAPLEFDSNSLLIDPEQVQYWKDDYGDFPVELNWVELEDPEFPPYPLNANDPNIVEYARKFDYLRIEHAESGRPHILQTHGYKLSDIFTQSEP